MEIIGNIPQVSEVAYQSNSENRMLRDAVVAGEMPGTIGVEP